VKIITLVEDRQKDISLIAEHGLSFYIETNKHKILFDLGQSDLYASNAKKLGIHLESIDTVVISHGHYDHGGGLEHFLSINNQAKIYIMKSAFNEYYSMRTVNEYTYVGLSGTLDKTRFVVLEDDFRIDDELILCSHIKTKDFFPSSNTTLYKKYCNEFIKDDFDHEQNLLIHSSGEYYLFAGCAHKGIINVISSAEEIIDGDKISMVFSGFHLKSRFKEFEESLENIIKIAYILKDKQVEKYYTGHCTGSNAFAIMKGILDEKLINLYAGFRVDTGAKTI